MQSVSSAFTAEEQDSVRKIAHNLLVSWNKHNVLGNRTFTIGVSTIGGPDIIGINPGAVGGPGLWQYDDESGYVMSMSWERSLNIPLGGLSKAAGEVLLDNTSGRFLPDHMGGTSSLFTAAELPKRPIIFNAGFNYEGIDQTIPQFAGITSGMARVNERNKTFSLKAFDYVDFFQNRYVDQTTMFTAETTDQIIERLLVNQGMSTAQYELDTGLNTIPFGYFEKGDKISDTIHELVEAENGHFFQDEEGVFHFWNRQHWSLPPYTNVQRILTTSQVINVESPNDDHLINVVEVKSKRYAKQPSEQLFKLASPVQILAGQNAEIFVNFDNPIIELNAVEFYTANTLQDETGTDITSSVTVKSTDKFTNSAKIIFTSSSASDGFITQLSLYGRAAKPVADIYLRSKDDSSVTAYEEQPTVIENKYIQDESWANSLSQLLLNSYSGPDRLQDMTIRAIPELQFGDLVSWRGLDWRVYGIRTRLDPSEGFVQDIVISQSQSSTIQYFTIGVSTIGSTDIIAP